MPVESATYISDLNASNPLGTDEKSQGDDHLRLLKSTIKATFPNLSGAMTLTHGNLNALSPFFTDPNADRIAFWDDSAGAFAFLAPDGTSIAISGTTLQAGSNVPLKNANNLFTGQEQRIQGTDVLLGFDQSGAASNERIWWIRASGGQFLFQTRTDADGAGENWLAVDRTGTNVDAIALSADAITLNGVNVTDYARLSQQNTFTGATQSIANDNALLRGMNTANDTRSGYVAITTAGVTLWNDLNTTLTFGTNNTARYEISGGGNHDFKSGSVTTANDTADEVGYKGAPSRDVSSSTNTAASDAGKTIRFTGGSGQTFTLDSDPPEDSVVILDNAAGAAWTIAASGTLIWAATAGTGNRTLADDGLAVAIHRGSGVWVISGGGLT